MTKTKIIALLTLLICLTQFAMTDKASAKISLTTGRDAAEDTLDPYMSDTLLSGPTTELPWENDPGFADAIEKNGCPILMGAYKTVLLDPLPGEESNVHLAASYICGTIVEPNSVFSQNRAAGPYTESRGYRTGPTYMGSKYTTSTGGGVCKIASTLYNVAILSNLEVVERHPHSMPVPYVPYGQDATVYYGVKDFKFRNNTNFPVLIWAKGIDNILYIGFYGKAEPPEVVWNHEVLKVYKAPVYYEISRNLPPKAEKVVHEGMNGGIVNSWLTLFHQDGSIEVKKLGKSYYNPLPYIKEIGG